MKLVVVGSGIVIPEVEERHVEAVCRIAREAGLSVELPATTEQEIAAVADAEVSFGGLLPPLYAHAKRLRWVQTVGAGVDRYLGPAFVASDVVLTSEKGLVGVHLADHAFALLLALTRGVATAIRQRRWDARIAIRNRSWELDGRTAGLIGLGGTGLAIATRARGFGMRVLAVDPEPVPVPAEVEARWGTDRFHDLLGTSDVVFVSAPLTEQTRRLFDATAFQAMRPDSILINVSRGGIVDIDAMLAALASGQLRAAGLDVTPEEPLPAGSPLWDHPNVVITPHIAGASPRRGDRIVGRFGRNLAHFLAGEPLEGVIDKVKQY